MPSFLSKKGRDQYLIRRLDYQVDYKLNIHAKAEQTSVVFAADGPTGLVRIDHVSFLHPSRASQVSC